MQRIGRVLHISSSRNVVLKAKKLPRIGDKVVDEQMKPVGTVFDVFGPVSSPYVSVKANMGDPDRLVDCVLYAVPSPKPGKRRRNRR
ncbi:MAG: H/ACA ribonucleoprotein complex subunit GAR1 [Candidatus Bathyarchaeia archaeon]